MKKRINALLELYEEIVEEKFREFKDPCDKRKLGQSSYRFTRSINSNRF